MKYNIGDLVYHTEFKEVYKISNIQSDFRYPYYLVKVFKNNLTITVDAVSSDKYLIKLIESDLVELLYA